MTKPVNAMLILTQNPQSMDPSHDNTTLLITKNHIKQLFILFLLIIKQPLIKQIIQLILLLTLINLLTLLNHRTQPINKQILLLTLFQINQPIIPN